jgi:hypothetical protein
MLRLSALTVIHTACKHLCRCHRLELASAEPAANTSSAAVAANVTAPAATIAAVLRPSLCSAAARFKTMTLSQLRLSVVWEVVVMLLVLVA